MVTGSNVFKKHVYKYVSMIYFFHMNLFFSMNNVFYLTVSRGKLFHHKIFPKIGLLIWIVRKRNMETNCVNQRY